VKYKQNQQSSQYKNLLWSLIFLIIGLVTFVLMTSNVLAQDSTDGTDPIFGVDTRGFPDWLVVPVNGYQLYSKYALSTLAGHLVNVGLVDASSCPNGAFLNGGAANECATNLARPAVLAWQNQFNDDIMNASKETGVPGIIIKNIFIWESQFWPKAVFVNVKEYGLGHITEAGADSTLRWNNTYYLQLCRKNFSEESCKRRYADQDPAIRNGLMGVVIQNATVDCASCPYGLDLPKMAQSVDVFANTLLSNANLVNMVVTNYTGKPARESVSYQNLWKFSLTSYNAGPGCFVTAFSRTFHNYKKLDWTNFSSQLDPACRGAVKYVDFISNTDQYHPSEAPGLQSTATPTPTPETSPTTTGEVPTEVLTATPTEDTPTPTMEGSATPTGQLPTEVLPTSTPVPTEIPVTPTPTVELPMVIADQLESPHVPDEVVLKIDPQNRAKVIDTLQALGVNMVKDGSSDQVLDSVVVQLGSVPLGSVLAALQTNAGVVYAEPNYLVSLASLPNDPLLSTQPNLWNIQAPAAWDALPSMQEVLVAVLDTGVDVNHPDLLDSLWQNAGEIGLDANGKDKRTNGIDDDHNGFVDDVQGWNFVDGNTNVTDDNGHGTHLAGIIGATVNNAIGIAGIAPNARILPVKVLDNTGYGTYAQVAQGIIYATDMGARIINLGFAGLGSSQMLQDAVDYAIAHGVLVVAASGNGGMNTTYYPASYPGVISVGAVDSGLNWAPFSSSNDQVSLVAPGVGIYSTYPGGTYRTFSGTSMASAHVSGVAALLAGQPQIATADSLRSALLGSAYDLGTPGKDPYFGSGIVHAFDALGYSGPVLPTPIPWIVPTSTIGGPQGVLIQASQDLWGLTQTSTYTIVNPSNSIDSAFNDLVASSTGPFGAALSRTWTISSIGDTTLSSVALATLDVRFSITGWVDDYLYIQIYDSSSLACGSTWCTIMTLRPNPINSTQMVPPSTLTTVTFNVSNILNSVTKVNDARLRLTGSGTIGSVADNITMNLDEVRLHVLDVLPPTPTPTSTPVFIPTATLPPTRAITATPLANEPHNNFMSLSTDFCASCHRTHSAQSVILRSQTGEEQVCYSCHTSGSSGIDIKTAFSSNPNTSTSYFSHPVSKTVNIHLPEENLGASFGGVNRHVECEDCHDPHSAARTDPSGSVMVPSIQQEMYNATGVDPVWTATGAPSIFNWISKADREYQVCLKCHSSFTSLPTYIPDGYGWTETNPTIGFIGNGLAKLTSTNPAQVVDSRDMAQEFNPFQVSFHPVASLGRNQSMPSGSFVSGWSQTSMVYCTDCHQNASTPTGGNGPHGSPNLHLLDGSTQYITRASNNQNDLIHTSGEICFKCHQYNTYANSANPVSTTNFRNGTTNLHGFHEFASCYTCHDSHGSGREHLINFDLSVVTPYNGYDSQTAWQYNSVTGTGTCYVGCHTADHGTGKSYTP